MTSYASHREEKAAGELDRMASDVGLAAVKAIRNSAKAIIIDGGQLLAIKQYDVEGDWYTLPGGGQHPGETLVEALRRECREELGVGVEVGPLRHIREYIGANHEFAVEDADAHQVEFMFECVLLADPFTSEPILPDERQVGIAWLPLADLASYRLYPKELRAVLAHGIDPDARIYLGDTN
ncbi:MAG: NUDIX domain-containing protein [Coprothermobacterota bacterium]|nr:NUDIX domain-containing protein [Coprothermobacterota bacterium]